uniref:Histidine phosphatase family protein n=1 Tax=Heterorhabditis bacteriophora TaxID=37862 RepID=A0A1I7WSI0_HETBA
MTEIFIVKHGGSTESHNADLSVNTGGLAQKVNTSVLTIHKYCLLAS